MKVNNSVKLLASALCAIALIGCQGGSGTGTVSEGKKDGKILVQVNGNAITSLDFDREVKNLPEYLRAMADTPSGRKEMLETMIIRELIIQQATKDGIDKGPEIEDKLRDMKKRLVVESFLKKKVEAESKVSDEEMNKFYEANKDKFKTGEQVKASHILVKSEKEAKDLLAKLKAGGNFEEIAKKNSADSSAAKGGDLGWFGKGNMVPPFEKAAFGLKEGQISDIVKSDFGFHIIKLTGKRPAGIRPLEEVKEHVKNAILPTKQQEIFQKIKDDLKKAAKIEMKDDSVTPDAAKKGEAPKPDAAKPAEIPKQPAAPDKK